MRDASPNLVAGQVTALHTIIVWAVLLTVLAHQPSGTIPAHSFTLTLTATRFHSTDIAFGPSRALLSSLLSP
jgi:hypothetical protein